MVILNVVFFSFFTHSTLSYHQYQIYHMCVNQDNFGVNFNQQICHLVYVRSKLENLPAIRINGKTVF